MNRDVSGSSHRVGAASPPLPRALREAIDPWVIAADGDEELAMDLLHAELRQRLHSSESGDDTTP